MLRDKLVRLSDIILTLIGLLVVVGVGISVITFISMIIVLLDMKSFTSFYDVHNVINLCIIVLGYNALIFLTALIIYVIGAVMPNIFDR